MKPSQHPTTDSSLLIPNKFFDVFEEKTIFISREEYFSLLLHRYKELALGGIFPKTEKPKTSYQEKDQNLIKVNFRPNNDDWIELGIIAHFLGVSRTALFTWFLILELAGWDKLLPEKYFLTGVPAKINTILGVNLLTRRKESKSIRKIYYKRRE